MANPGLGGGIQINSPYRPTIQPTDFPISFDWTSDASFSVDLQSQQSRKVIDIVQTVFVDNRDNTAEIEIVWDVTYQRMSVPANGYAYLPVLCPNPPKFVVSSLSGTGTGNSVIHLLNVPLPSLVWAPTSILSFNFDGSGNLLVDDSALLAFFTGLRVSNTLPTNSHVFGNNDIIKENYKADSLFTGSLSAAATSAIISAAAGQTFFLTDVEVYVTNDATLGAAGELTVTLLDGATVIATGIVKLLATAAVPTVLAPNIPIITMRGINYNGKADASDLSIVIGTALTAGKVVYNIGGGLTAIVGP